MGLPESKCLDTDIVFQNRLNAIKKSLTCQIRLQVMEIFWLFNAFFLVFSYIITSLKSYNFVKLLQIVCIKAKVYGWKVNRCNLLWLRQSHYKSFTIF